MQHQLDQNQNPVKAHRRCCAQRHVGGGKVTSHQHGDQGDSVNIYACVKY